MRAFTAIWQRLWPPHDGIRRRRSGFSRPYAANAADLDRYDAPLGFVLVLSSGIQRMSAATATALVWDL